MADTDIKTEYINIQTDFDMSLAYREGRFAEIFEAARSNRLREEEKIAYSQSLEKLRDTQAGIRFAADSARAEGEAKGRAEGEAIGRAEGRIEGRAEGRIEGRAEGRVEGRAEGIASVAVNLLRRGMDVEFVASATGLSVERIRELNGD